MKKPNALFVLSIEEELLTAVEGCLDPSVLARVVRRLFRKMMELAPSLPGAGGFFNGYGRVYCDVGGHVELSALESDCPYRLALLVARQHELAARAAAAARPAEGTVVLANCNHNGVVDRRDATWGTHENHLVEKAPQKLAPLVVPFLATRIFAGAGAIRYPTGDFVASARAEFMDLTFGGGTTHTRAIFSTAREEHLMGPRPQGFRLHLIVGDGHRSQFNLALQAGATALALKAATHDRELEGRLERRLGTRLGGCSLDLLRELNLLARPGDPPRVRSLATDVQETYLDAARRTAARLEETPSWVPRILEDWQATLDAYRRGDREWLATRLDAFAKYEFFSAVLADAGASWGDLPGRGALFDELALQEQSYHELSDPRSVFARLEEAQLVRHAVGERIGPGEEAEPFVPEVATRAKARARFIAANAREVDFLVDWDRVVDLKGGRQRLLTDPFATEYGPWEGYRFPAIPGMPLPQDLDDDPSGDEESPF
jgi:hypothetical protein